MSEQNNGDQSAPEDLEEEVSNADSSDDSHMVELQQSLASCEDKLKRSLADFINLERKTKNDIENGVNEKLDRFMLDFLTIYDDLTRAKEILKKENPNAQGLDSILKNIDSLLLE